MANRNQNQNQNQNTQLQERPAAAVVKQMLEKNRSSLIKSLPRGFDNYDRMSRAVINAISTTPQLAQCTPDSLFLSIVKGFAYGLEPNGLLGHGYLVPFKDKGVMKAQFMPGYRGLIDLARRTGEISEVYATEVYENDKFEVSLGTEKSLIHKPDMFSDRGQVKGWYAVFRLKDGSVDFEIMGKSDIEKIRKLSKAGGSDFSPWNSGHYDEMARKTVIKKLLKRAPQSIECAAVVDADNRAAMGEAQDNSDIIDIVGGMVEDEPEVSKVDALSNKLGVEDEIPDLPATGDIEKLRKQFHAAGFEFYGADEWDEARGTICYHYKVKSLNDLTPDQLVDAIAQINAMASEK